MSWSSIAELQAVKMEDNGFKQIMAFAHLDNSLRYLNSLGYDLFNKADGSGIEPVLFDAAALSTNNSSYYVGPNVIYLVKASLTMRWMPISSGMNLAMRFTTTWFRTGLTAILAR